MAKPTYFWGVFNVDKHNYLASHDSQSKAVEAAKEMAKQHVGETFVVLTCEDAFTSRVSVERAYFDWPTMPDEPATPQPAIVTRDAIGNAADEDGDPIF